MEKIINISGKEIKLASTAGTLHRYRMMFKRDLLKDVVSLENVFQSIKNDPTKGFAALDLEIFENVAYALAATADKNIQPMEHWLDQFDTFDIYKILPVIMEMLYSNFQSLTNNEKKVEAPAVQVEN